MSSKRCRSIVGGSVRLRVIRCVGGFAICVLSLATAASEIRAQGIDPASASAEAPMVNLPSDTWGQASRMTASGSEATSTAGSAVNMDRQSSPSDPVASSASRTEAVRGSAAPMDPAPADDIAVAATPTALPVVQRSAGTSAGSGSITAAPESSAAQALAVPAAGDYDGPPQ
jgi:hypothetical protein